MKMRVMFHLGLVVLVILFGTLASGFAEQGQTEQNKVTIDRIVPYKCGTITHLYNYGGILLYSQPNPNELEQLNKCGVKTVINLRHEDEVTEFNEREIVSNMGLNYINLPWKSAEELNDAVFDRVRELLNTEERPALLHCSSANRAATVWLPWRVLDEGAGFEEALEEAKRVGLKTPEFEEKARDYIERKIKEPD